MASMSNGYLERTARNALRRVSTASAEASSGRRRSVTTVKKNEPPGMNARRYLIEKSLSFSIVGLRSANPTYIVIAGHALLTRHHNALTP